MYGEQILHISGINSPNFIKGSLQSQGNKDLVNRQTQWFRRKLWAKENHPLEGPKTEPCWAATEPGDQPCSQGTKSLLAQIWQVQKRPWDAQNHRMVGLLCLFNKTAPLHRETKVPDMVFADLHQKTSGDSQRTATCRTSCFLADCKHPNGLKTSKPTLVKVGTFIQRDYVAA